MVCVCVCVIDRPATIPYHTHTHTHAFAHAHASIGSSVCLPANQPNPTQYIPDTHALCVPSSTHTR